MKTTEISAGALALSCVLLTASALPAATSGVETATANPAMETALAAHNVVWDTPSKDAHGSMPLGNGDDKSPIAVASKLTVLPDVVAATAAAQVVWYHRNTRSLFPVCLEVQHLATLKGKFTDPLLNLTFGASLRGVDMVNMPGK